MIGRYPRHALLGAFVGGMLAARCAPVIVALAAAAGLMAVRGRGSPGAGLRAGGSGRLVPVALAGGLAVALLAGAVAWQARSAAFDRTALGPLLGHAVAERVIVLGTPQPAPYGGWRATVRLRGERVALSAGRWVARPDVAIGAELRVQGMLRALGPAQAWQRARGVHAALAADAADATGRARGGASGFVDAVRRRAERALRTGTAADGLLRGMVLGEGEALDPALQEDFRTASLTHLVAASGQNVALLAALAVALGTALGLGLRARLGLALALVALYVPLAGAGPSIQRAGVMGAAVLAAGLAGRPASRAYALLLAAALTLLANPHAASDPGWQLSFAAVVGIAAGASGIAARLRSRGVPRGAAEAVAMTFAATVATAPLIALHFGRASLVALPANLLAAPAVAPAMWLGALAATAGQVSATAAAPLAALAALPAAYLAWLGHAMAALPGTGARLPAGAVAAACAAVAVLAFPGAAGVLGRLGGAPGRPARWPRRAALAVLAAIGLAGAAAARPHTVHPPAGLRISFLDVGQGDATLVQDGPRAVLVDAGPPGDGIAAKVRGEGAADLDLLVVTHAQADHEGGAAEVLSHMRVGAVLDGRDGVASPDGARFAAAARGRGVRLVAPAAGQVLHAGGLTLTVLSPPPDGRTPGADPNDRAIVLAVQARGVRLLLTADAESDVLGTLSLGQADVLKVSHHGSADPGLPALLAAVRPRIAAIEVGRHNSYGHPAPATIAALAAAGVRTVRTDEDGTVRLDLREGRLAVTTHA